MTPRFDIYNLTNSGSRHRVDRLDTARSWLRPTEILTARLLKFGVQVDW